MLSLIRTHSDNTDFRMLVTHLDADLKIRDGEEHAFYNQYNKIDAIKNVVVAYYNNEAVGCGAVKPYNNDTMEVKRMYVFPQHRGKAIATAVLQELENWCREMGFTKCVLETGKKQPEAIQLYTKNNYKIIPNFGQYAGVENSVCFEKVL